MPGKYGNNVGLRITTIMYVVYFSLTHFAMLKIDLRFHSKQDSVFGMYRLVVYDGRDGVAGQLTYYLF